MGSLCLHAFDWRDAGAPGCGPFLAGLGASQDGLLVCVGEGGFGSCWRIATDGKHVSSLQPPVRLHGGDVHAVAVAQDLCAVGSCLVTGAQDGGFGVWQLSSDSGIRARALVATAHSCDVRAVALVASEGGKLSVSGGDDCTVALWRISQQDSDCTVVDLLWRDDSHLDWIYAVSLLEEPGSDNCWVCAAGDEQALTLMQVSTLAEPVNSAVARTSKSFKLAQAHESGIFALATHAGGGVLATASACVGIWSVEKLFSLAKVPDPAGTTCNTQLNEHTDVVEHVASTSIPDSACSWDVLVATASRDHTVRLWFVNSNDDCCSCSSRALVCGCVFLGHSASVVAVDLSCTDASDGEIDVLVASGSQDETCRVWEAQVILRGCERELPRVTSNACRFELAAHEDSVTSVFIVPPCTGQEPRTIVTSSPDEYIILWSCATGVQLTALTPQSGHEPRCMAAAPSDDSEHSLLLMSGGACRTLRLWTLQFPEGAPVEDDWKPKLQPRLSMLHEGCIVSCTFVRHRTVAVSASFGDDSGGHVCAHDLIDGTLLHRFEALSVWVTRGFGVSSLGHDKVLAFAWDRKLFVLDIAGGTIAALLECDSSLTALSYCAVSRAMFVGDEAGKLNLCRIAGDLEVSQ